jgi:CO/xanthine dehydrogenase Mo-binding subunit
MSETSTEHKYRVLGTRPLRPDGPDKVTGRANYGADFALPGMLVGAVLRSPHAHARILSIDASAALAIPGVEAVVTGADLPTFDHTWVGVSTTGIDHWDWACNCIARDRVLYHGHAVAAVAATSPALAREAAQRIDVRYEVLPAVLDIDQALAEGAPVLHPGYEQKGDCDSLPPGSHNIVGRVEYGRGDPEQSFAEADVVVEREFDTPMVHQGYIEPHACVARCDETGQVMLWTSTQGSFMVRDAVARILDLDKSLIKVVPSEIGGGFGGKTTLYGEPLAIELSRRTGRPVKIVMSREEVFRATGPTSGSKMRMKLGARRDGSLVAARASLFFEAGAYRGAPVNSAAMAAFACYRIPNFFVESHDVLVNKPKVGPYRAPGAPMSALATESLLDEIARELEMDPIEIRERNAVTEGDESPYGPRFGPIGLTQVLKAAREHPHYKAGLGPGEGRGVAAGFWYNAGMQSSASVRLTEDGAAIVATGNPDIGGSRASMAMMVSEELGIPYERIRAIVSDTDSVGFTDPTGGSRTTHTTGMAVVAASRKVVDRLRERAALIWGIEPEAVAWREGSAVALSNAGHDHAPLSLAELAAQMAATGGPVAAQASLTAAAAGPSFALHLCDVEVDPETGRTRILRYTAVQDAGRAIHPSYVEGQMQGGAAQGIGWALNEAYLFDAEGVLTNPGFLDYRMPVASDLPMIDTRIVEVPNPLHPYGVRGVGEVPIVPALAAVANAVRDATGVRISRLPLSPPRVLEALESKG